MAKFHSGENRPLAFNGENGQSLRDGERVRTAGEDIPETARGRDDRIGVEALGMPLLGELQEFDTGDVIAAEIEFPSATMSSA